MPATLGIQDCLLGCPFWSGTTPLSSATLQAFVVILILKNHATDSQIDHIIRHVEALGLTTHLSRGTFRTIIGLIGDESLVSQETVSTLPGVAQVIPVLPPYKLASREARPQSSVVDVSGVKIGGGNLAMIAGPCSVEDRDRMMRIAESVRCR